MTNPYRGRFAPSPTGPLHFGSLVAAVASYLQARRQEGEWWLRIEDIDPPREVPGASDTIIRTLSLFGFEWTGEVIYQSRRREFYQAALEQLRLEGRLYPCACSRKDIALHSPEGIYPGTCRHGMTDGEHTRSWRLRCDERVIRFTDGIQGEIHCELAREVGDFVLKRADGLLAYHLAVAVDDALQGMTEVVRGVDLLACTAQQIYLHQLLGHPSPDYLHHPIAQNAQGQKLSKQNLATPLDTTQPVPQLWQALQFLGQSPPPELRHSRLDELWQWAAPNWRATAIPRIQQQRIEEVGRLTDKGSMEDTPKNG
jgi:glutamyl-Q tRNA(Asp) synthetase